MGLSDDEKPPAPPLRHSIIYNALCSLYSFHLDFYLSKIFSDPTFFGVWCLNAHWIFFSKADDPGSDTKAYRKNRTLG